MKIYTYFLFLLILSILGCQKEYLEKSPNKALLVPTTLIDFQNLLDNLDVFNIVPSLPIVASDDFFGTDARINSFLGAFEKNSYIWAEDIDEGASILDWNAPYKQVFYANVILDGIDKILPTNNQEELNTIKGSALFHRAFAFYNIATMYAKPYDANTASSDLGIPIKLESDVTKKPTRGTLQQTYNQIISDLNEAEILLNISSAFQTRPNKIAVKALFARLYLSMGNYPKALDYAKQILALNNGLIDYNTLNKTSSNPFPVAPNNRNIEIIFYARTTTFTFGIANNTTVDNNLYQSYATDDLRRIIFFTGNPLYLKGRFTGNSGRLFGGISTSEIYFIKAECEARIGSVENAMADLNAVLRKRWSNLVAYPVITASNAEDALRKVLIERRKELVFRGLRWDDLRRLNKDGRFATTITRQLNTQNYTLLPNSNRYTFPIPRQEILANGIEQNER